MTRHVCRMLCAVVLLSSAATVSAQQVRFDDVIRNLRNPDPKTRLAAVQLLRASRYPEAIAPMAALVTDPVDQIQLEAIAAELSFFLIDEVPSKKHVAFLVEVRNPGKAPVAFDLGPLAVAAREVPPELVDGLLKAIDDENPKVRSEAIYTLGTIARPPVADVAAASLIKALDHYDPAIRAAAARVAGRLQLKSAGDALIKAINDSQAPVRFAAMRALGEIRETRAVPALTDQFNFYGKGEGAWSALDALAQLGDVTSVALFKAHLGDKDPFLRRASAEGLGRARDTSETSALEIGAGNDSSEMVRAAMAFALQKIGRKYVPRLVESLDSDKDAPQIAGYFMELGPSIVPELTPHLQDPSPAIRANVATVLGALGSDAAAAALQAVTQDKDRAVVQAAARALERIKGAGPKVRAPGS